MAGKHGTAIEWTHIPGYKGETWNPFVGCSPVSDGCKFCYACRQANRFKNRLPQYEGVVRDGQWTGRVNRVDAGPTGQFHEPLHWRKPRAIFVCSMSDFFHEGADEWREFAWHTIYDTPQHLYLIPTKRPERIPYCLPSFGKKELPWEHVWLGVTIENKNERCRANVLRDFKMPARNFFLSLEPLLEDLGQLNLSGVRWVIVGGESGPGARPCHPAWIRLIREQCRAAKIPFFFKGWGAWAPSPHEKGVCGGPRCATIWPDGHIGSGNSLSNKGMYEHLHRVGKKRAGRLLDGRTWEEFPL